MTTNDLPEWSGKDLTTLKAMSEFTEQFVQVLEDQAEYASWIRRTAEARWEIDRPEEYGSMEHRVRHYLLCRTFEQIEDLLLDAAKQTLKLNRQYAKFRHEIPAERRKKAETKALGPGRTGQAPPMRPRPSTTAGPRRSPDQAPKDFLDALKDRSA